MFSCSQHINSQSCFNFPGWDKKKEHSKLFSRYNDSPRGLSTFVSSFSFSAGFSSYTTNQHFFFFTKPDAWLH